MDKDKIILMTKLAIKDKTHMKKDKDIVSYYKRDYVALNNFKTRLSITFAALILIGMYIMWQIENGLNMPTTQYEIINEYIVPFGSVLLGFLIVYTIISSLVFTKRYNEAKIRCGEYQELVEELKGLYNKKGDMENDNKEYIVSKAIDTEVL